VYQDARTNQPVEMSWERDSPADSRTDIQTYQGRMNVARIRTIKPEFFRNAKLYDSEQETGLPLRLVYAGLWTAADRDGRFKWNPRELKLDCLPYDDVDFSRVLHALSTRGYIVHYASESGEYGCIPSWNKHQVINNRETASILPQFIEGTEIVDASPTREARVTEVLKGKGREGKGKEGKNLLTKITEKTPSAAPAVASAVDGLYGLIRDSFLSVSPTFTNWAKEGASIKRLIGYLTAHAPGGEEPLAKAVIVTFKDLIDTGDKFWQSQPFTPSALASSGIFDRVLSEARKRAHGMEMAGEIMEIPF